jgi:hypothetical protein
MNDTKDVMEQAKKTVETAEAIVAEVEEQLRETKKMFELLGQSHKGLIEALGSEFPEEEAGERRSALPSPDSLMQSVFGADKNRSVRHLPAVDIQELRSKSTPKKYKFV